MSPVCPHALFITFHWTEAFSLHHHDVTDQSPTRFGSILTEPHQKYSKHLELLLEHHRLGVQSHRWTSRHFLNKHISQSVSAHSLFTGFRCSSARQQKPRGTTESRSTQWLRPGSHLLALRNERHPEVGTRSRYSPLYIAKGLEFQTNKQANRFCRAFILKFAGGNDILGHVPCHVVCRGLYQSSL